MHHKTRTRYQKINKIKKSANFLPNDQASDWQITINKINKKEKKNKEKDVNKK